MAKIILFDSNKLTRQLLLKAVQSIPDFREEDMPTFLVSYHSWEDFLNQNPTTTLINNVLADTTCIFIKEIFGKSEITGKVIPL